MTKPSSPSPHESLELLDSVCTQVKATRPEHIRIEAAVEVLSKAIKPPPTQDEAPAAPPPAETMYGLSELREWLDAKIAPLLLHQKTLGARGTEAKELAANLDAFQEMRLEFCGCKLERT